MPRHFKIHQSNPAIGKGLCCRCRFGIVYERANLEQYSRCDKGNTSSMVPGDITACTGFVDKTLTERWDMEQIAWTIRTDKSGTKLGFERPKPDK